IYVPLGLAKYNPKRFFIATLTGKLVLSYSIVFISHHLGMSLVEPYLENITDVTTVYIGIIIFGVMMTLVIVLLLRLNWEKILGRFVPWTLDENNEK
ncbi:MAG: DedA family protein, partial [Nitrosopumilales archaeon CG15_BIG_FIL_POST_REV_8_21_14_020_33_23]